MRGIYSSAFDILIVFHDYPISLPLSNTRLARKRLNATEVNNRGDDRDASLITEGLP
jgi:hypothetical protein